ncbi:hypothetical protein ABZ863_28480 [Saccharomonospora sp. NPDC046836]|uniref:hypothetical protein n=1 Tax=Saccharomonospora sp. NPDC046836 TaxID=3156921 RepID=UPI0033C0354D
MPKTTTSLATAATLILAGALVVEGGPGGVVGVSSGPGLAGHAGKITYYAARDNDPAGTATIAYPRSSGAPTLHDQAGGTGTFADPLTFAAQEGIFEPGTRIYVPHVQRYFMLEDICATCDGTHVDLWTGPAIDEGVIACENRLTLDGPQSYQVDPPPGLPVEPGYLYRDGQCYIP